jgi:uncharacterized protein YhaN
VRIERLQVDAFGKLEGFDSGTSPLGPLVVVLGPNEAGKSTLFTFLTTALYGFQPASRERNPHVPWTSDEAAGEIRLRLAEEGCVAVSRRLRSSPTGKLTIGDVTRELRNQPLPWVEHIPRTVFRQVFAITLSELAGLDEDTWARIQDRVLGAMGTTDLRPARGVAEALEREASELWRPNRRGNQRLRELQEEVRALRGRRLEALERDRSIRLRVEELEDVRHKLREMRSEREREIIVVERAQELLPVKRQLERVDSLRAAGGPKEELAELPDDVPASLEELARRRERCERDLAEAHDAARIPQLAVERYDDGARALQGERARISDLIGYASATRAELDDRHRKEARLGELDTKLDAAVAQLVAGEGKTPSADLLVAVSLDLLRERVRRLEAEREARATEPTGSSATPASGNLLADADPLVVSGVLIVLGAAATVWGTLSVLPAARTLGVTLMAVGLTLLAARPRRPAATPTPGPSIARADRVADMEREVADLFEGLQIRSEYFAPPGAALLAAVERIHSIAEERSEILGRRAEGEARLSALSDRAGRVAASLREEPPGDPLEYATSLEQRLGEADRVEEGARVAQGELGRITTSRKRTEDELRGLREAGDRLRRRIEELAGAEAADPVVSVQRRVEAHARADRMLKELEHAHPDLPDLEARIRDADAAGSSWALDDADLASRRAHLADVQDMIEGLVGRAEALETEIAHLRERETIDAVDSRIVSLQEDERRLADQRDRTWLMAQLLREADRRFREEHQPDLLRRASGYLARLTGGRYDRLLIDEHGEGDLFHLVGPGLPRPVPLAPPISTGTLEQAYLSLRLAIVDHLDRGTDRLPLFIDEALVNWDEGRRRRGLEVLSELADSRQIFAFTCHPEMASQLEALGARVLTIED